MKTPRIIQLLFTALLVACAGVEHSPDEFTRTLSFESDLFGEQPKVITVADIYRLSDEQQESFQTYFDHPTRQDIPANERVYEYLESLTMNFGYHGNTYAAEEALRISSGNCLSLAILTTALAKLAAVEIGYQLVDSIPVFESQGNVVFKGQHVRTKLYDPWQGGKNDESVIRRGGLLVDYFPHARDRFVSNISEPEYHAMFYNNLASEAISREDYSAAFWLLRKVTELTPDNASAINSMAIVYGRAGNDKKSEEIYRYGIRNLPRKVSLLRNYRILLIKQGRFDEAERISATLAKLNDPSPFDWLHAGQDAYRNGDFREAIIFYEKAVGIAPYLHESYAGLAKAHYKLGDRSRAKRELLNGQRFAYKKSIQSLYQAKLMALAGKSSIP